MSKQEAQPSASTEEYWGEYERALDGDVLYEDEEETEGYRDGRLVRERLLREDAAREAEWQHTIRQMPTAAYLERLTEGLIGAAAQLTCPEVSFDARPSVSWRSVAEKVVQMLHTCATRRPIAYPELQLLHCCDELVGVRIQVAFDGQEQIQTIEITEHSYIVADRLVRQVRYCGLLEDDAWEERLLQFFTTHDLVAPSDVDQMRRVLRFAWYMPYGLDDSDEEKIGEVIETLED